jgi:hypothetical protein
MKDMIVFPHCPKTGGTTLKERYRKYNDNFSVIDLGDPVNEDTRIVFGHMAQIGKYESLFDKNIVYCTCVRDPIERMMSMYNFYKTQLAYMNPDVNGDIDFYTWFINKDVIRPMAITTQYEYYLYQHVDSLQWFEDGTLKNDKRVNDMYLNTVLTWDVDADTSYVDMEKLEQCIAHKQDVQEHNMNVIWDRIVSNFTYVLFQDTNIVKKFDQLLESHDMNLTPWREMTVTNETKYDLYRHKLQYTKFSDLDSDLQYLMRLDLKADIDFYNRCKEKWKH